MDNRTRVSEPVVVPNFGAFPWTDDMDEISGFGGGYELTCRNMASAACAWLAEDPKRDPKFHGYQGLTGVIVDDNDDAKALSAVVSKAAFDGCTGAMHQYSITHALYAHKVGWPAYQVMMREKKAKENPHGN